MQISQGPFSMPRSGIREIADLAWKQPGAIRLEMGEPDFSTPAHVVETAARAAHDGQTRYAPNAGLPELREALAAKIERVNGLRVGVDELVVSNGAAQGLFAALTCMLSPGDEILLPNPGWPNFRMMARLLGARSVGYNLLPESGFEPDFDQLERSITERTRVILVNSPSNPLGSVLSVESMQRLLDLARRHDLWVVSDECYDQIVFDGSFTSFATLEDRPERVVSTWSLSKTFAMTGWRVGYVHAPAELVGTLCKVQEPLIACVNTPAQHAAIAAITGPQDFVADSVAEYRARRDLVWKALESFGVRAVRPNGAFYAWVPLGNDADSTEVARRLVTEHGVAVAPGSTFGSQGNHAIRLSLAASREDLREGLDRVLGSGLVEPSGQPAAAQV
ncbi:pyridoxal phosphate-dependent aminotransferase [Streptomyces sp. NPDC056690]|uniref:pyridoxal phosphate-dependent aminotransferase n=1 Tax=unclassified Streptomyces TaxID=2593676 RepID=UPI00363871BD